MNRDPHLEALRQAADPARIAATLGLRGRGKRYWCPSCQSGGGKTPDLSITDKGFRCFKCGESGDLFALVQFAAGLSFPDAVKFLERETGIYTPHSGPRHTGPVLKPSKPPPKPSSAPQPPPEVTAQVFRSFLDGCRPVEGRALEFIQSRGASPGIVERLGIKFCGRELPDLLRSLGKRFGDELMLRVGFMKGQSPGRRTEPWMFYHQRQVGFLVIPYFVDGQPLYLKARPCLNKAEAEAQGVVRFMNTAGTIPAPYNVDVLRARPDQVIIAEGESDTWAALSAGYAAVGIPGAKDFKSAWAKLFRGCGETFLAFDGDKAGREGTAVVADMFLRKGLRIPKDLALPEGMDLAEFLKTGKP